MKNSLITLLEEEQCSCVVRKGDTIRIFRGKGVSDLLRLLKEEPQFTAGASIADKVVGKGAAALMVLCRFGEVYAEVLSTPARRLLDEASIRYTSLKEVPNIVNRRGDGICPVESLCADCTTAGECLPRIEEFVSRMQSAARQ